MFSSVRERLFGAVTSEQLKMSMSDECFAAVLRSCKRFRVASDETDPAKAKQVMQVLSNFAFCRDWIAAHPHEVSVSQLTTLVAWRERACGLHDEL